MYNHAKASCVKILERADYLALNEIKNWKVSVKQKQTFATVKLEQLMNFAAKYFRSFCLMSRTYQVVGQGVI